MNLNIDVSEKELEGFTEGAKDSLRQAIINYSNELVKESYRIEAARNVQKKQSEVTGAIVDDAVVYVKMGLTKPKKDKIMVFCKIASSVASLFAGALYDPTKFTDGYGFILFIIAVVIALITITYVVIKE
ncbi:hypothetical protein [Morganella morganii]|uniref:hypothetical protein n=1 Tax=Morganella morganii TaxID=582 RepID=UPI0032DB95D6